ncbi:MAG: hypothetical protein LRY46_02590 [Candidatus Pacebacteria bacterium]|nr:hypothetical protein [Candidatus Paceibacterota bacterium]
MTTPKKPEKNNKKNKNTGIMRFFQKFGGVVLIFVGLLALYTLLSDQEKSLFSRPEQATISEVAQAVIDGSVQSIVVRGDKLEIILDDESVLQSKKRSRKFALYNTCQLWCNT